MKTEFSNSNILGHVLPEDFQKKYFHWGPCSIHASTLASERVPLVLIYWSRCMLLQYLTFGFGVETLLLVKHNQLLLISPTLGKLQRKNVGKCSTMNHNASLPTLSN
ncbi:hypothetical protein CXB51_029259 [Gossypium anomalum]|uniref:Uncharacterized protein n=1 Tax=Gossypium anomalum TaxID=47600 RepID=A0A8J6CPC4_9ROSI|nr:hypothetical protein CXB51_029259 [Gossypium anomalum]